MQCPVCKEVNLVMADRQGIEIDYCPQCRGVWLDRGELDKIIERSAVAAAPVEARRPPQARPAPDSPYPQQSGYQGTYHEGTRHEGTRHEGQHRGYKSHKRKSLLSELFDF